MQARFLLGPAGSGKTFRCLAEIREELRASASGPPLLLIAPKQATFQLERLLLADAGLPGYNRLQILSFDRLARFVLGEQAGAPPDWLDEEGRVMVLRALLAQRQDELKTFRATARLPGFARQLSALLREVQRHKLSSARLRDLAANEALPVVLRNKLHDLALMLESYLGWLKARHLQDADSLPDLAAAALVRPAAKAGGQMLLDFESASREVPPVGTTRPAIQFAGLWLDGFAEMTPQELDLLAALLPSSKHATLAFCLESEPKADVSWLSTWSAVAQSFRHCHQRLANLPGIRVTLEVLKRNPKQNRFRSSAMLTHLEQHWSNPSAFSGSLDDALRLVRCANPEAEAVLAAREIRRAVRERGLRYRDCAVLLRSLDGHHDSLRRVLTRYGIPFFLDRREPVTHHPLAELTRFALRIAAFHWRRDDWFGALKTGLVRIEENDLDRLENAALAYGWEGDHWQKPLAVPDDAPLATELEAVRLNIVPPFAEFSRALAGGPTGAQLATAVRVFWETLGVSKQLEEWGTSSTAVHLTVWKQMHEWLDNVESAFATESMPLREWLPVLEAGLANLTVGVVPPALDQVLVGAIDRSRNPELKLALILGVNETIFPAPPAPAQLLTDADHAELDRRQVPLGLRARHRLGHERYFGYIACTRSSGQVILSCSRNSAAGVPLNPSPFFNHVQRLFPAQAVEEIPAALDWRQSEHVSELLAPLIELEQAANRPAPLASLEALPPVKPVLERARHLAVAQGSGQLSEQTVRALYGKDLAVSVHALEDFAACPFKFFVARGLRAGERQQFEVDHRERGSFQHEILKEFHRRVQATGRPWREMTPAEARALTARIGEELLPTFRHGLFNAGEGGRFSAHLLIEGVQKLVSVLIGWAPQYEFDPHTVELAFGFEGSPLPGWHIPVDGGHALFLRGRIDRVDLLPLDDGTALAVVVDYKSRAHNFDPVKLEHGLQLQLLAYLGLLRHLASPPADFDASKLIPAGVFYVSLRGGSASVGTRVLARQDAEKAAAKSHQHRGRFNADYLSFFDTRNTGQGNQFSYREKKDGGLHQRDSDPLSTAEFLALLDHVESQIKRIGSGIFGGDASATPFRKGQETACNFCEYRSICRFDPWVKPYRTLRAVADGREEA